MNPIQLAVLRTLSYFHVFKYPLKKEEIWRFLQLQCDQSQVDAALAQLVHNKAIFRFDKLYCLQNDIDLISRRIDGNERARKKLRKARIIARFLGAFPFVEAVCISGSLSKNFAQKESDLDFFIITAPNRLWIARSLMHFYKKLTFIVNAQHSFCMNYYVSLHNPEIFPKTLFTATELATLKPAYVRKGFKELIKTNEHWILEFLPNMEFDEQLFKRTNGKWLLSDLFERIINTFKGDSIEKMFYQLTLKKWLMKWRRKNYDIAICNASVGFHFNAPINVPRNLPEKVLQRQQDIANEVISRCNSKVQKDIKLVVGRA